MKGAAVNVSPAVIASGLLALLSSMGALALEETPAVKVTPLVKTTSSWTGKPIAYPDGQALVEVIDTLHNGRNVGKGTVRLVVFYAGAVGVPLTVKP